MLKDELISIRMKWTEWNGINAGHSSSRPSLIEYIFLIAWIYFVFKNYIFVLLICHFGFSYRIIFCWLVATVLFFIVFSMASSLLYLFYILIFWYVFIWAEGLSETPSYIQTTLLRTHLWDYSGYVVVIYHLGFIWGLNCRNRGCQNCQRICWASGCKWSLSYPGEMQLLCL